MVSRPKGATPSKAQCGDNKQKEKCVPEVRDLKTTYTMNNDALKRIFQQSFDYTTYSNEIVHRLFGCNDVATNPELLDTNSEGDKSYFIGQMEDADGRLLGFFYTRVADGGDVRRKRVGLRKLIQPYLKYDVDGAIAVFDDGNHWRLSYICDLKEGNTAAKRFSYILGDEQGQYKTPIERLGKVAEKNGRFKLSDLREAFSVDALSKEFFDEYHRHYDIIINELKGQGFEGATIHDYVKKMMGRIVFLHFLQKKGWLNGNLAFLRDLFFFSPHQGDFLEQVLEPLFFGILNTEKANREQLFKAKGWDMGLLEDWKELPYLNGGLFERDAVDEQNITLPASLFEDLFTFMASYNFTVDENDPDDAEVGVDPEMLGKIFESLLEDNKAKGAFYTPKEIVRYMCKESLIAYLDSSTNASERHNLNNPTQGTQCGDTNSAGECVSETRDLKTSIRIFVERHEMQPELEPYRDTLDAALREVKICDPAIGSGAFPMGLLNELWRCREAIEETSSRVELKKEIIENNIYGVDIERGAIDIARLRFWLSIVVDAEEPEPLPNFDYKFMQGNSLIESYKGIDLSRISNRLPGGQSKSTQLLLGLDSDFSKKNLQRLMRDYFSVTDHKQKASMRQAINDEVKRLITDFIGGTSSDLEALDPSANQDFFLWHTWFKDIFDNGGFDIVIGNPPYIQLQADGGKLGNLYKNCGFETFARTGDIYSLFYEQGWKLLNKGGHLCFITSNKWMRAGYGESTRKFFASKTNPLILLDLGANVFENATVDTNILLFSKSSNTGKTRCATFSRDGNNSLENLSDFVQQQGTVCSFDSSDSWVILSPIEQSIKRKIEAVGTPLKDWDIQINYGIKTGCNEAFIITTEKRDEILANCHTEEERQRTAELIRPILRGRDIKRYSYNWAGLWLINTHNGVKGRIPRIDINDYPAVKEHLDKYWDMISSRADKGDTPYNLRNCAYLEDFSQPKIIYSEIVREPQFFLDNIGQFYPEATVFIMTGEGIEYLYHAFHTSIVTYIFKRFYAGGGLGEEGYRYKKVFFEKLPIPKKCVSDTFDKTSAERLLIEMYNLSLEEVRFIESQQIQ